MALGSFAGGLAKGFTSTYGLVSELEEKKEEREFRRKERERAQTFRDITAEELGQVGQTPQTSTGAIRQAVGINPEAQMSTDPNAVSPGIPLGEAAGLPQGMSSVGAKSSAIPAGTSPITREDALMRIYQRGLAVDPDKAFDIVLKGMQLEDVLSTRKDKKEFKAWREGFNNDLTSVRALTEKVDTDPQGFMEGTKKYGVEIRPISVGEGKTVYEAYSGNRKIGQYDNLKTAAEDGFQAHATQLLMQGAARFAATPDQFVSILSAADKLDMDRRKLDMDKTRLGIEEKRLGFDETRLGFEGRRLAAEEGAIPARQELTRAQIAKTQAEAAALGPSANRDQLRLDLAQADQFRKQLADIDAQLVNYPEGSPQYKALAAQRNQVAAALRDVNAIILGDRGRGAGGTAATGTGVEAARAQALTGKRPDGKPYTAQDKSDYERIFGEPFPTAEKGAKGPVSEKAPDRRENIFFTRATPRSIVEEAARAGNPKAQAELARRQEVEAARGALPLNSGFQP